jgi:hypothetical protein
MTKIEDISEFEAYKSKTDKLVNELDIISCSAKELCKPIINKLAKALVKQMNANLNSLISDDYYELGVRKFFDYFTIRFQSSYIDEIVPNLTDVLVNWIEIERSNLPKTEKFILDCSMVLEQINHENINSLLHQEVMYQLVKITNAHYETQRILRIADKI